MGGFSWANLFYGKVQVNLLKYMASSNADQYDRCFFSLCFIDIVVKFCKYLNSGRFFLSEYLNLYFFVVCLIGLVIYSFLFCGMFWIYQTVCIVGL